MVAGTAASDAVARARRLPKLRTGLHVVLVEGTPALPPEKLPDLVDGTGQFRTDMARLGFDIFTKPAVRAQLAAEVEAQFAAYAATGLPLDHVNAHKHFHLHPTIAGTIIAIGRRYSMKALRVPVEPRGVLSKVERAPLGLSSFSQSWITGPYASLLGRAARRAGLRTADAVFGLAWSGAMTAPRVEGVLRVLPEGLSELYTHPGTGGGFAGHAPGYRYADELAALTSPEAVALIERGDIALGGYADF
jgi:hopanoid biosynthesis associated protein HpnK